jgi:putative ABC transport system ATP-binding protein
MSSTSSGDNDQIVRTAALMCMPSQEFLDIVFIDEFVALKEYWSREVSDSARVPYSASARRNRTEGAVLVSDTQQPFVRLESVSKAYGSGSSTLQVLDGLDLDLPRGETTSLVGRSGTGKSTLLSLIAGLMRPDSGHVYIGGQQMDQLDDDCRASLRADRIGFVLQSDNLIPFLTAVENVELAMGFAAAQRPAKRARELLSDLGLRHRMDHLPRQLSGGESQRVAVAVALANEPDLLLADEVVGQLDSTTAADVMEMIFTASRERNLTVLYVTHDEQLARQAHRSLRLTDRKVVPV